MDIKAQFAFEINTEVEKRRQVLLKLVDQSCACYQKKYENLCDDISKEKDGNDIDFLRDVASKVAPISEKKVASQLRNAMRLETEFRDINQENENEIEPVINTEYSQTGSNGLNGDQLSIPRDREYQNTYHAAGARPKVRKVKNINEHGL